MHHELIATVALSLIFAFPAGLLAARLGLPPLVGYLFAGVLIGPNTPGLVADGPLAQQLAEIGVMLLMFGVGLHFSLTDLRQVRNIAVPGAILQIAAATLIGALAGQVWGWAPINALVFGLTLSVASTVVLLKALEVQGLTHSRAGRIAIGWLIVEDLAMVLVLVMLPALTGIEEDGDGKGLYDPDLWMALGLLVLKITAFVALMLVVGARLVPALLQYVARLHSDELFTLSVIAVALGIAYAAAEVFEVSFALGTFLAGMVVNGSPLSHRVAANALPFKDAFAVLFFVSVGMLLNPAILAEQPGRVLLVLGLIVLVKAGVAATLVLALRQSLHTALTVAFGLAQIGEFSFILAALAGSYGFMDREVQNLILAAGILSIALNPLLFRLLPRLARPQEPLPAPPAASGSHEGH